jgi:hypothetical protein
VIRCRIRTALDNLKTRDLMRSAPAALCCPMRGRFQKIFWLSLDHLMPDGPPVFLMAVVLLLLIVNGGLALSRW